MKLYFLKEQHTNKWWKLDQALAIFALTFCLKVGTRPKLNEESENPGNSGENFRPWRHQWRHSPYPKRPKINFRCYIDLCFGLLMSVYLYSIERRIISRRLRIDDNNNNNNRKIAIFHVSSIFSDLYTYFSIQSDPLGFKYNKMVLV